MVSDLGGDEYTVALTGFGFWFLNCVVAWIVGPIIDLLKISNPRLAFFGSIQIFLTLSVFALLAMVLFLSQADASDTSVSTRSGWMLFTALLGNFITITQPLASEGALTLAASSRQLSRAPDWSTGDLELENLVLTLQQLAANIVASFFISIVSFFEDALTPTYQSVYVCTLLVSIVSYILFFTFDGEFKVGHMSGGGGGGATQGMTMNTTSRERLPTDTPVTCTTPKDQYCSSANTIENTEDSFLLTV
mmetsp:Transcript_60155/g.82459  ORF Transcript_60155/g.82459 Transcript_60155/m.82459 type:complete len:249 (-) Transcript_60155:98-844(-)